MTPLGIVLVLAGVGLVAIAAAMARAPLATIRRLDATEANLRRYDAWRGGRRTAPTAPGDVTGADAIRAHMRRRLLAWGAVGAAGAALVLVGLLIR
jgi:hypothetical protein